LAIERAFFGVYSTPAKKILTLRAGAPVETRESFPSVRVLGSAFILCFVASAVACGSSDDDDSGTGGAPAAGRGGVPAGDGGSANSKGGKGGTSGAGGGGATTAGGKGGGAGKGGKGGAGGSARGGAGGSAGNAAQGGSAEAGDAGEPGQGGTLATGGSGGDSGSGGDAVTGGTSGAGGTGGSAGANPGTTVLFAIDATASGHAISPLIYGINPESVACSDAGARFTLCRLGGDRWSTYNWENNASNAGAPLCFQNDGALGSSDEAGKSVTDLVSEATASGAAALVTVPMLDYVAADKLGGTPPDDCSGDVRKSGSDYLDTRFKANAITKGTPFVTPPDTTDDSVYEDEFVAFVKAQAGSADVLFALDNQPGLWGITQEVVHPDAPTYAEVVARNVAYAKMLREQWSAAPIAGYVGYGWLDFISLQNSPDAGTLGPFVDYYLAGMADASATEAHRLLDYLDVHWFPEVYAGSSRIIYNVATPEAVAARVQNPRSLWDASFVEDSWVAQSLGNQPIRLIPWLKERIAANYPDTKLAISEWNYGGGADVSGAIAAADALGVFGREDVGVAAWKSLEHDDPFVLGAFRMFRNYDGAGAAFGDVSLPATSDSIDLASVYASADTSNPGRVVIVAINRAGHAVDASLSIEATSSFTTAATYVLTSASALPAAGEPLTATSANAFTYAMPAYSVSVIVPAP